MNVIVGVNGEALPATALTIATLGLTGTSAAALGQGGDQALGQAQNLMSQASGPQGGGPPSVGKSHSPIWRGLRPYRGKTKANGLSGKKQNDHEWDHTHGDIEVDDSAGRHLGTMDPTTGNMTKPPVKGRMIEI
jgi:hypothetical protein